ncbi:unnamed protein product [Phytomonas sp. Hart1]|nr:unnamed protein product [Phytomonas sp. Hart1]|eukprot:CCW70958.1 unnamed protein product [Phytomonas sp. isolate Hart1]
MVKHSKMDNKECILPQLSPVHIQHLEQVVNPSSDWTARLVRSPLHKTSEIIPTSQSTSSGSNELNNLSRGDELSSKMAVVPFVRSAIQNSTDAGEVAVSGALTSVNTALSSRRLCPTCLRPFYSYDTSSDAEKEEMGEMVESRIDGTSPHAYPHRRSGSRMLTSAYFRMLAMQMPLAIGDSPDSATTRWKQSRRSNSEFYKDEEQEEEEGNENDKEGYATNDPPHPLPLCYYLSPTESMPQDYATNEEGMLSNSFSRQIRPPRTLMRSSAVKHRYLAEDSSSPPPLVRETVPYHQTHDNDVKDDDPPCEAWKERNFSLNTISGLDGYYARYFIELQKLGSGTYGGVYLCQHVMEGIPLGIFALKKVPVGDNLIYLQKVLREVRILGEVNRHPNVVEYNHSWVETAQLADFGPPVRCLFILMEYATEGSLDAYMERHGTALSTLAVWYFFLSAVAGTTHLHRKDILHRDLKPQNLLLTGTAGALPRVLVSDFGTAALLGDLGYERTGGTGTLEYMAPELLECDTAPQQGNYRNRHTKASDTWSLGMILHYLACNATLPGRWGDGEVALDLEANAPYARPPEMVQLIRAMLQLEPERRPSCQEILQSTVAQTILRSFNSQTKIPEIHLYSPYVEFPCPQGVAPYGKLSPERRPQAPRIRSKKEEEVYDDNPHLQSSKVELISTSAMMNIPLLMQYHTNDAMAARGGSKDSRDDVAINANSLLSLRSSESPSSPSTIRRLPNNIIKPNIAKPQNRLSSTWASPRFAKQNTVSKSVQTDLSLPFDV